MKAKEEAENLVLKYLKIDNNTKEWFNKHIAKQCALIAVNEILNNDKVMPYIIISYWKEVKKEIKKL